MNKLLRAGGIVVFFIVALFLNSEANAQQPTEMTLEGGFSVGVSELGSCIVCVPPSNSGSIRLVVNFETGAVSGNLRGEGAGPKTTTLCNDQNQPTNEQATAQGQVSYSGDITGSINPQSGVITARATIRGSSSVSWVAGCEDCPTSAGEFTREATINGTVTADGFAGGQLSWASDFCGTAGEWNAQAIAVVYPPTSTPTTKPTETTTPTVTVTPTATLTPTPTATITSTFTPEPTETATPTLFPTASPTPAPSPTATSPSAVAPAPAAPSSPATGIQGQSPPAPTDGSDGVSALVQDLEAFLAGEGVKAPAAQDAAAGAAAIAALLTAWVLTNLIAGVNIDDILAAVNEWRNGDKAPGAPAAPTAYASANLDSLPPTQPPPGRPPATEGAEAGTHRTLKNTQDYVNTFINTLDQTKTLKDTTISKLPGNLKNSETVKKVDELTNTTITKIKSTTSIDKVKNAVDKLNEHAEMHEEVDKQLKDRVPEDARNAVKIIQSAIKYATDIPMQILDQVHDTAATVVKNILNSIAPETAKNASDAILKQKQALHDVKKGVERLPTKAVQVSTSKVFGEYWKEAEKNNPEIRGIRGEGAFQPAKPPDFGKGWRKAEGWYEDARKFLGHYIWQLRDTSKPPGYYK